MSNQVAITPYNRFKDLLKTDGVQERFQQILKERAPEYLASLLSLVGADDYLQKCDPVTILTSAAKAAVLRLPISKELGYAYIVPFKNEATFIFGYKGMIQLAIRTGQYYSINATEIYEGQEVVVDQLTGNVKLNGHKTGDEVIGYAAYFKLKNGFEKFWYMSREQVEAHAKRYSKSWGNARSAWTTNFDAMAKKTVLRMLLSKWGLMSIEMQDADTPIAPDEADPRMMEVPDFSDALDGTMTDPEPAQAIAEAIQNAENDGVIPAEDPPAEPLEVDIFQAVVDAKLAENVHSAKNALAHCTTGWDTTEKAIAWMKNYRGFRDMGGSVKQAAEAANSGQVPH